MVFYSFFIYFSLTDKVPDPEAPAPPASEPDGAAPAAVAAEAAAEHDGRGVSQTCFFKIFFIRGKKVMYYCKLPLIVWSLFSSSSSNTTRASSQTMVGSGMLPVLVFFRANNKMEKSFLGGEFNCLVVLSTVDTPSTSPG